MHGVISNDFRTVGYYCLFFYINNCFNSSFVTILMCSLLAHVVIRQTFDGFLNLRFGHFTFMQNLPTK